MRNRPAFFILFFSAIIGCNKKTGIEVPQQIPVLVVNAQWQQSQAFVVKLTQSRDVLAPRDSANLLNAYTIKNGLVLIKENNIIVDTLKYDSVNYRYTTAKNKKTIIGNTYEIDASAAGFSSVLGASIQPVQIKNTSVKFVRGVKTSSAGILQDEITATFSDDGSRQDFYLFRIHKSDGGYADCINTSDTDIELMINDDPFSVDKCLNGNKLLFADKNFNGKIKTVVFYVPHGNMNNIVLANNSLRRPWLELLHITQDYFQYIKSSDNYDLAQADPFAEPANLFTNIKNGLGFFTCFTNSVDTLK